MRFASAGNPAKESWFVSISLLCFSRNIWKFKACNQRLWLWKNHNMQKSKVQHINQKSGEIPGFSAFCTKKMKMSEKSIRKVLILQHSRLSKDLMAVDLMVTVTINYYNYNSYFVNTLASNSFAIAPNKESYCKFSLGVSSGI